MTLPLQFDGVEKVTLAAGPLHLAIGIFDGVHLGHRAVIEAAVRSARQDGGQAAVLTFAPHPSVLLRPAQPTRMIMDRAGKAKVLGRLGVDAIVTQPFTREFAQIAGESFLPWLKERLPRLAAVYVGENWKFGRGRSGDVATLAASGRPLGIAVRGVSGVSLAGEPISSSRIRAALEAGDIAGANAMLGYAYFAEGVVVGGKRLGSALGFPTLNLDWAPELRPRFGVYVVRVLGDKSSTPLRAVANYGLRPTVEDTRVPKLEVHLLDKCPYGAGDTITVEWLHFLRPEQKFSGVDELRAQIAQDRTAAELEFGR